MDVRARKYPAPIITIMLFHDTISFFMLKRSNTKVTMIETISIAPDETARGRSGNVTPMHKGIGRKNPPSNTLGRLQTPRLLSGQQ